MYWLKHVLKQLLIIYITSAFYIPIWLWLTAQYIYLFILSLLDSYDCRLNDLTFDTLLMMKLIFLAALRLY